MSDERAAIGDRRDQIAAEPRPSVQTERPEIRETDDTCRVYLWEWVIVHTSGAVGEAAILELERYFDQHYLDRVYNGEWQMSPTSAEAPNKWPYTLEIRIPNVKAEFKTYERAQAYAREKGWAEAEIVPRNSRAEHKLKEYTIKKLKTRNRPA